VSTLAIVALMVVGCGNVVGVSTSKGIPTGGPSGSITISNEQGTTWSCGFNPFNAAQNYLSFGPTYEMLTFVDSLKNGATTPWLAQSYAWSTGDTTLTFKIRSGAKWTDGDPFSAQDVAYTFNLLKADPGIDLNAVWTVLTSVTVQNSNQVVFQFNKPSVPYFYYIADQTPIVPEHIWSNVGDPVTYGDTNPVGTGAYEMAACSPANIKYTANPHYWQPGVPKIETYNYPSFTSNPPANELLATGGAQWGSQFIPNIQSYYLSKSPDYHTWTPPFANYSLFFNLKDPTVSNLAVRQAVAYAINRPQVSKIAEYGYEPAANQTDVVTPTYTSWLDSSLSSQYHDYSYDPARAISILKTAGFTEKNGTFYTPSGQPLGFTIINLSGATDTIASVNVIVEELKAVGIQATLELLSQSTFVADLFDGNYQVGYYFENGGPSPYYELREILDSANSAPIGQSAASNWERYSSTATDALLNEYAATTNVATQHAIVDKLEGVMLADVPVIPVVEYVAWYQYDTADIGGWVTEKDPYAFPAAYILPDFGVVMDHLYMLKK
jgi:peptide/nickel transport system substrate-binding protein